MAIGAAATGLKPIVDIMFADILLEIMSPCASRRPSSHTCPTEVVRVPMVIRIQMAGKAFGPHHMACLYPI